MIEMIFIATFIAEMTFRLTFIVCLLLLMCVCQSLAEKLVDSFVALFDTTSRRRSKRVTFAKGLVTAPTTRPCDDKHQVAPILRVKRGPISFEERQAITRLDFEINNVLGSRMPREYFSTKRGNNVNVWAHNCLKYKNCPPREFFDMFIFREHFKEGYAANNSGLQTVLEEEFVEDDEANARDECFSLDTDQDDEDCRPTVSSEDDSQDCDTTCKKEEIMPQPITLRRSPRLAKLAKSLEPQLPPRRSARLRKKPRVDYSVFV